MSNTNNKSVLLLLVSVIVVGCTAGQQNAQDALPQAQAECLTLCLDAQNECFWALSASPCETFCQTDVVTSTVDHNIVCVDGHDFEQWADCQHCIIEMDSCGFGEHGGTVCESVCGPLSQSDAICE